MASSNIVSGNQFMTQTDINTKVHGYDTKSMARTFYDQMAGVMLAFANKDVPMSLLGVTLEGEDKYGVIGTTLLNQFMTDNGNAIETVMTLE